QVARADFGKRCESCPSSANRYYCASPLRNEAHIELLHTFERTASTRTSTQNLSRFACERTRSRSDGRFLGCEGEIAKIGSLLRGAFRPEDEKLASILVECGPCALPALKCSEVPAWYCLPSFVKSPSTI